MTESTNTWSEDQVIPLLNKVQLFDGLPDDDLRRIAAIVEGMTVKAGETLFEEGDPGDAFYIVFAGAVEIVKSGAGGVEEKLAVRRAGDGFGEMALLNDAPRSATVRAQQDVRLMVVPREAFQQLLGGDSLALRMMRVLSKALRAMGIRFANVEKAGTSEPPQLGPLAISRLMQRGMLPAAAPRAAGFDLAAGTTTEDSGRGNTVWDWMQLADGSTALVVMDVRAEGFPPAHVIGMTRAALRAVAPKVHTADALLAGANGALAGVHVDGVDQFVDCAVVVPGTDSISWACAGKIPGGMLGRAGTFEQFGSHGPALGMLEGFSYGVQAVPMGSGDSALVLSGGSTGLFRGAADLVAQVHGKPAGEVVSIVHKAIRKAQGEAADEISVLYLRKH